jgi:hypothetical protein
MRSVKATATVARDQIWSFDKLFLIIDSLHNGTVRLLGF